MNNFFLEFAVRDYELDFQGIVNNANYQHYLEHAPGMLLTSTSGNKENVMRLCFKNETLISEYFLILSIKIMKVTVCYST